MKAKNPTEHPTRRNANWRVTLANAQLAPRCGARTKRGSSCLQAAMPNGRCRMHGGSSTGPRTPEGLERLRAARTKHGLYSAKNRAEMAEMRRMVRDLKAGAKRLVELP